CRGQGLGRKLLQRVIARIARAGVGKVFLMVRADNQVAINLYRSMGFRRLRRVAAYYTDGQDAIRMRLDMDETC
ncbi:MAG: GNAT family N-acetyltransferase, partial [Bryobacterales bacterium]|nr:GNAT family N-acetyltransferase [Bryobacterales bacterium]